MPNAECRHTYARRSRTTAHTENTAMEKRKEKSSTALHSYQMLRDGTLPTKPPRFRLSRHKSSNTRDIPRKTKRVSHLSLRTRGVASEREVIHIFKSCAPRRDGSSGAPCGRRGCPERSPRPSSSSRPLPHRWGRCADARTARKYRIRWDEERTGRGARVKRVETGYSWVRVMRTCCVGLRLWPRPCGPNEKRVEAYTEAWSHNSITIAGGLFCTGLRLTPFSPCRCHPGDTRAYPAVCAEDLPWDKNKTPVEFRMNSEAQLLETDFE